MTENSEGRVTEGGALRHAVELELEGSESESDLVTVTETRDRSAAPPGVKVLN